MTDLIISCAKKWLNLSSDLVQSKLYDEVSFYTKFKQDLTKAKSEVIIESPFITCQRSYPLIYIMKTLIDRKVKVYVLTRNPECHDEKMRDEAETIIREFEMIGVQVLITQNLSHRKIAIIDKTILWEGSLNILSHSRSRELMRRIVSPFHAKECFSFLNLSKFIF